MQPKTSVEGMRSNIQKGVYHLWHAYHFNPTVRRTYNNYARIQLYDPEGHWAKAVTCVQKQLLKIITEKRIAIEINPTSNLCIAPIDRMTEHPVFRWYPPDEPGTHSQPKPYIMVGSDDPGVFATELAFEYATLARAAEERGVDARQVEQWLRNLCSTSKAFCFLNTSRWKE